MKVGTLTGLFPLSKLNSGWTDYYINAKGEVFSSKRSTTPGKLNGSSTGLFSLSPSNGASATNVKGSDLLRRAKTHKDWAAETMKGFVPPKDAPSDRDHAATLEEGIEKRGWIIGRVEGEALVFGSKPKVHTTEESLVSEMERLALANPGVQLIAAKIDRSVKAAKIVWA